MALHDNRDVLPGDYVQLKGSERRPSPNAKVVGEVDANEQLSVTIVLRRRKDGPPFPDFYYFSTTPPRRRMRLSSEEFTDKYGAHPDELKAVEEFAIRRGLRVKSSHPGRRHVVVDGTAEHFSKAFGVEFKRYELPLTPRRKGALARRITYRGRDGFIHVPQDLAECIVGVFGLDNRPIGRRSNFPGDTPIVAPMSVANVAKLYDFPTPSPAAIGAQTIGVVCLNYPAGADYPANFVGFMQSDLDQTYAAVGATAPTVRQVSADNIVNPAFTMSTATAASANGTVLDFASPVKPGTSGGAFYGYEGNLYELAIASVNGASVTFQAEFPTPIPSNTQVYFNLDPETTQDLAIAGLTAIGANLICYFNDGTQVGWVGMINRVLHPEPGEIPASVLSCSYIIAQGDDPDGLLLSGVTTSLMDAMSQSHMDAAVLANGPTICIASGDYGSNMLVGNEGGAPVQGDGYAHVSYPASDPWVLAVGGTTLGQYLPSGSMTPLAVEFPWNAPLSAEYDFYGTGGGGVSDYFPVPSYQSLAEIPDSINLTITTPSPNTIKPPAPFNQTGRGVPDVAANANIRTGFSGIAMGGVLGGLIGNGTSAATPLWAGLIALLNASTGTNIGFVNPTLYTLGAGAFNRINPLWRDPAFPQLATCPLDNGNNGIPGYPTGSGWDAVTGLGSPNGGAILDGLKALDSVYILGGYQSPDIVLTDPATMLPVPIGGLPGGRSNTLLKPATNYNLSASVSNDGPNEVHGVIVSFWAIPGGVGTHGSMIGMPQTVSVPANQTVPVAATAPFRSALEGHLCAAVSIYSPPTGCTVPVTNALDIPDPGYSMTHQCSAWRNTDSIFVPIGGGFHFPLGFGHLYVHFEKPIGLTISAKHVPVTILNTPAVTTIADTLRAVGARSNQPLYLLPSVLQSLEHVDLRHTVKGVHGIDVNQGAKDEWLLRPHKGVESPSLEITGKVPETAKAGDVLLVHVAARYPRMEGRPARTVEFLEFVYVTDRQC